MKILISPSKTQKPSISPYLTSKEMLFPKKHKKVLAALRKLSKDDIGKVMKLSKDLLDKTYYNIKNYNTLPENHAFMSFTGFVFFGLEKESYQENEFHYIENNILVLDAFYGLLEPGTLMKEYRLDFTMKIGMNLYDHWDIESSIKDDLVINLASNEFSKMLPNTQMVTIQFLQFKNGKHINQATYSKQARGIFLNYMIQNKIESLDAIKEFALDGYSYNTKVSDDFTIVFTR